MHNISFQYYSQAYLCRKVASDIGENYGDCRGSRTEKVLPVPTWLSTSIFPP